MRKTPGRNRNMASNIEKREKLEIYTVGPGIWQENLKNVENEKHTLQNLEYVRKQTNEEDENIMVGPRICQEN